MTIAAWLTTAIQTLQSANIPTPRLDAEILLADLFKKDRSWLVAHQDSLLTTSQFSLLSKQIARRTYHEPLAYIREKCEFYGRTFAVNADTLQPRPETETLVSLALSTLEHNDVQTIADVGTGSGCIAISIEQETNSKYDVAGYDVSAQALAVAKKNKQLFQSSVSYEQSDISDSSATHRWADADLILANLPYVPTSFKINLAASHEPALAIYGGADGLDYYRRLFAQIKRTPSIVICESMPPQHTELAQLAAAYGYSLTTEQDFIQVFSKF